jgi:surfeit locus 1 family protein
MTETVKRQFRPGLWATVFGIPLFLLLIGLGTWQIQRLHWKEGLIAQIDARIHEAPVPLPADAITPDDWSFRPATAKGVFEHDKEIPVLANRGEGLLGYEIVTPLKMDDGRYVLVDRGWVPQQYKDPKTRQEGQVTGEQTITGFLRLSDKKPWAVPANRPQDGLWLYADLPQMEGYLGLKTFPMFLQADKTPNPGGLPMGGQTRVELPNNHLQYVITWYALAVAFLVIFVTYHMKPVTPVEKD